MTCLSLKTVSKNLEITYHIIFVHFSSVDTSATDVTNASSVPVNGLTRSRRSHFSRKDSTPEGCTATGGSLVSTTNRDLLAKDQTMMRIVHEYERLMYYAKSPHSWALPSNWAHICEAYPAIVRNKVNNNQSHVSSLNGTITALHKSSKVRVTNN